MDLSAVSHSVLTDQHKLPIPAWLEAQEAIAEGIFTTARKLGVRTKLTLTMPGTVENDGNGVPYMDTSEKASNQGTITATHEMDPTEPVFFPTLGGAENP